MAKKLNEMNDRELAIHTMYANLEGMIEDVERMTSGNYMHNKNSIKLRAKVILNILNELGIKEED